MPAILYVDMDDVLCGFAGAHSSALRTKPDVVFPQSVPGFFRALEPLPGAIDAVNELRESFAVYILTAPSVRNAHSYTEKRLWIEDHFDLELARNLILCGHKNLLKGDYLVDDRASGKGQDTFEGKLIQFGSPTFPDWPSVSAFLKAEATRSG